MSKKVLAANFFIGILLLIALEFIAYFSIPHFLHYPVIPNLNKTKAAIEKGEEKQRHESLKVGDRVIWSQVYNFDQYGRRVSQEKATANRFSLFFGCSFTFGEGLKLEDTLASHYSDLKPNQNIYNYASPGTGPNHFLHLVQSEDIDNQIPRHLESGDAFFFSYSIHTHRYLGSLHWVSSMSGSDPYYYLEDRELVDGGTFATGRQLTTSLYRFLSYSYLVRALTFREQASMGDYSQKLLCEILNSSAKILKEKMRNRLENLYFIVGPFEMKSSSVINYYKGVQDCLSSDWKYLDIPLDRTFKEFRLHMTLDKEHDWHPNGEANQWLAQQLQLRTQGAN